MRAALILFSLGLVSAAGTIKDGVRGNGTAFTKCGGSFLSSGNDRCFEVILKKLQVQIGSDGTDDDVKVKVCSDDQKTCCTTPPLKKSFSDDWSSNDLEQWNQDYFGPCKGKKFKIKRGLDVTIEKAGKDSLAISSFTIDAEGITSPPGQRSPETFDCGRFIVTGTLGGTKKAAGQTNFCGTSPYSYERIKQVKVAIGPDGTNDDVRVEFCSDVDSVCCRTKLSTILHDDWSKNDDEVWKESDLGSCKTVLYKVKDGIRFTLLKNGKDDLVVNKLTIDTENLRGASYSYDCKGFKLASQGKPCVEGVNCKQEKLCPKTSVGAGKGTTTRTTTKRTTTRTTTRKSSIRGSSTTTKKPGLLDRIKGSLGFGGKKTTTTTTTTTTTRRGLLSQVGGLITGRTTQRPGTTSTTTRRPFRG